MTPMRNEAENLLSPEDLGRLFTDRDRFMNRLGIELIDIGVGFSSVRMKISGDHLNFNGTCHGGVIFSLADCAFGTSSNSYGAVAAGIHANISYLKAANVGDILTAVSTEVSRSRKLATYDVTVTSNQSELIASFTGTVYIIAQNHDVSDTDGKK